jgi:hypothetical protein
LRGRPGLEACVLGVHGALHSTTKTAHRT